MWPLLRSVVVHESVIERIRFSVDRYAPVVLPQDYQVERWYGGLLPRPETDTQAAARVDGQDKVWNETFGQSDWYSRLLR